MPNRFYLKKKLCPKRLKNVPDLPDGLFRRSEPEKNAPLPTGEKSFPKPKNDDE